MGEVSLSSRHGRALSLLLTAAAIAMALTTWWYYTRQRAAIEEATIRELTSVGDARVQQIATWRRERLGDGRVLANSPASRIAQQLLSGQTISDRDRADIIEILTAISKEFEYTNALLVDLDGIVRMRLNSDMSDSDHLLEFVRAATRSSDVILSDLYRDTRNQRSLMALIVPVHSIGAFVLGIDASRFLFPYLQFWPTASASAEALLVRREGDSALVLNDLRNQPGTSMLARTSLKNWVVPTDEQLRAGWLRRGLDYRGVEVLSSLRSIPDSTWVLVAKIDSEEVQAPIQRRWWEMVSLVLLIGIANVSGIALIWRSRQLHENKERDEWARTIADDTPAYLWMSTEREENSFINKPLAKFLGKPQQRLSGAWSSDLHPDDATAARDKFHDCQTNQCEYSDVFRLRRFDGEYRWVLNQGSPRFVNGRFTGYSGSVLDITDRKHAEELLREANATLEKQLRDRTRAEKEIQALSARLINAQEEERARIARELHDDLSQGIASLSLGISNLKRTIPQEYDSAHAQSERLQERIVQLAENVRRLSHQLHPAVLEHSGLAAALRSYCSEFEALNGVHVRLSTSGSFGNVSREAAVCLYRITQEALQNVVKHAAVREASVTLDRSNGALTLTIADKGVGIGPEVRDELTGLGLVSIKERTRLVNGTMELFSVPNEGTTLRIRIPEPTGVLTSFAEA